MNCIVLVLENPYFATANDKGHYTITNVPPGNYKLKAWHERLPGQIERNTVPDSGEVQSRFHSRHHKSAETLRYGETPRQYLKLSFSTKVLVPVSTA